MMLATDAWSMPALLASFALHLAVARADAAADAIIATSATRTPPARLNVLMLVVDDLRPELKPWGFDTIHTPHIDALAESALTFTQAHVQQAVW